MTLVANHVALNSRVIGCNEHESYFAFHLIYHNNTDVKIDMLTGDNHSINQMNFVVLDAIDTEFTPEFCKS
ncbi:Tn3 family transposase [Francisella noatunensis]